MKWPSSTYGKATAQIWFACLYFLYIETETFWNGAAFMNFFGWYFDQAILIQ